MCHISSSNAPQWASLPPSLCLSLCLSSLAPPLVEFGWCAPRGGAEGGAHLVSALYESDVYVCNCGYGWLNSRCPSGSEGSYQSVSGSATQPLPELALVGGSVCPPHAAAVHRRTTFMISASIKCLLISVWNVRGKKKTFSLQFSQSSRLQFEKKKNHKTGWIWYSDVNMHSVPWL